MLVEQHDEGESEHEQEEIKAQAANLSGVSNNVNSKSKGEAVRQQPSAAEPTNQKPEKKEPDEFADLYGPSEKDDRLLRVNVSQFGQSDYGSRFGEGEVPSEIAPETSVAGDRRNGFYKERRGNGTYRGNRFNNGGAHHRNYRREERHEAGGDKSESESMMRLPAHEIPNLPVPGWLTQNKIYYDMFPEIDVRLVNSAVELVPKEEIRDQRLITIVTRNSIYREYALAQADQKAEAFSSILEKQEVAEREREERPSRYRSRGRRQWRGRGRGRGRGREDPPKPEPHQGQPQPTETQDDRMRTYWAKNFDKAVKMYEAETERSRKVLMCYHVNSCHKLSYFDHKPERCKYYHKKDEIRRRPLFLDGDWNYYPVMCQKKAREGHEEQNQAAGDQTQQPEKKDCKGEICMQAHNATEINYHPLMYKTRMCDYRTEQECPLKYCDRAHNISDLRNIVKLYYSDHQSEALMPLSESAESFTTGVDDTSLSVEPAFSSPLKKILPLFDHRRYKARPCPNVHCSDKQCPFFHNPLERRRDPDEFRYGNLVCEKVLVDGHYSDPKACPRGDRCPNCHTKNEFYYHEMNYKVKDCTRGPTCHYGIYCPDRHSDDLQLTPSNEDDVARRLQTMCEELKQEIREVEAVRQNWKCSRCGQLVRDRSMAMIVLCCRYISCSDCTKRFNRCFKCGDANYKAVSMSN